MLYRQTHKIIHILMYSLFCVLTFVLPACRLNFTEVACTTLKAEKACSREINITIQSTRDQVGPEASMKFWRRGKSLGAEWNQTTTSWSLICIKMK